MNWKQRRHEARMEKMIEKESAFNNVNFCENTLFSVASFGVIFGTGTVIMGIYSYGLLVIYIGTIISAVSLVGTIWVHHKLDKARDLSAYIMDQLRRHGHFRGSLKAVKHIKGLHAQQMEQMAKEEHEKWLEEKSKNKVIQKNEKAYHERKRALESVSDKKKRKEMGEYIERED